MVWMTKELGISTNKVEILTSSLSDHSPILWQMNGDKYGTLRWRLNQGILDNSEIVQHLKKDITEYFDTNLTPDMKLSTVWDAFKAVLRGRMIKWNSIEKKKRKEKLHELPGTLIEVEQELKKKPRKKKLEKQ